MVYSLLVALILTLVVLLFRERRHNAWKLNFLLDAVSSGDYAFKFSGKGRNASVNAALNRIATIMQDARTEALEREKYYELIIDQVNTGILVINDRGSVLQSNREARCLLGMEILTHTKQLSRIEERLETVLNTLRPGEKDHITFLNERGNVDLSIRASAAELKGEQVRIVALNDINSEMDDNQMDSWNKLIRVLTHEIMNTVTPISSLSETLLAKLNHLPSLESLEHPEPLDWLDHPDSPSSLSSDLRTGLSTIHQTSLALLNFVENYRRLTHLPTPVPKPFYASPFCERMKRIAQEQPQAKGIAIDISIEPQDLLVYADEELVAHVIINLLKNALQAISTTGVGSHVWIRSYSNEAEAIVIDITNDGPLIPQEVADHIFVPFFTTKQDGSGIGLSISRQIMKLSGGTLSLKSDTKRRLTTFELVFP